MGGNGSGRPPALEKKAIVDSCMTINLPKLVREKWIRYGELYSGTFTAGSNNMGFVLVKDTIILDYRLVEQDRNIREHIRLSLAPCYFGGQRLYIHCPGCQARVLKLYLAPGYGRFLCRTCGDLSYESRQDSRHGGVYDLINQMRRADKEERRYYAAWKKSQRQRRKRKG